MSAIPELIRFLRLSFGLPFKPGRKGSGKSVFISLTTLPHRIDKIVPAIRSLIDQSIQADCIYLHIPKTDKKGNKTLIPKQIQNIPGLILNQVEKDLGPATKFLPLLKDPEIPDDALIIVVDDDQVYPKRLVESYIEWSEKFPKAALTLCGWKVPSTLAHQDKTILRGAGLKVFNPAPNISEPTAIDVIQGASSYAIRKRFFDQSVFNYSAAPRGAFFADDIWISGHLARRNISRYVIKCDFSYCRLQSLKHLSTKGLRDTANADNRNNDELYRYFKDDWPMKPE